MTDGSMERTRGTEEYFEASFDQVVNAAYSALSSLGMYVEDRYRSGLDQVISVQSTRSASPSSLLITIAQPQVQGVRVSITSGSQSDADPVGALHDAQTILSSIRLQLGMR
jgi:hypothetical protein